MQKGVGETTEGNKETRHTGRTPATLAAMSTGLTPRLLNWFREEHRREKTRKQKLQSIIWSFRKMWEIADG